MPFGDGMQTAWLYLLTFVSLGMTLATAVHILLKKNDTRWVNVQC